ncbi:uncharacterized protein LOC143629888 [Bidens hawaiensis]|uniref:uncharacterized protein LOC143629888 n=1 Tax=Bidens hawaiensis TaxID=980011 RepID=UPI0040497ECF
MSGCIIEAVSATISPSRKWAKKYPVKVENKSLTIYHGSKLFYMYFETSCEKESWCKALRLASCDDTEKLKWFDKSRAEFHSYLASLNVEYPSFLKPSIGFNPEIGDRSIKVDSSSSKVHNLWKKLAKKGSKAGREDKKIENSVGRSSRVSQTEKKVNNGVEEKIIDTNVNDKMSSDDGTLCCNLLISRLFFDAKSNANLRISIQERIQRTLSAMRTPSYIGEIVCTGVNPGSIPPYISGMRVRPSDLKEVVAMEIDIEYYGGVVLDIGTRIEMQELENSDSKSVDDVTTDEGSELNGEQLKLNDQTNQTMYQKANEVHKLEDTKNVKGNEQASSTVPKWKFVLNSVAKQVSQVPLSLAIRVTTLRGTLRVHIKPPPSDQIWFGFKSMPDIDFSLESAVGDHKITSGHIALFIISKFKAAIRDTMVLPNSESVTIPFMLAEKNDWVPQKTAPFIWTKPDPITEPATEPTVIKEPNRPQPSNGTRPQELPQDVNTITKSSTETAHDKSILNQSDNEKSPENSNNGKLSSKDEVESDKPPSPQEVAVEEKQVVMVTNWRHPSPSSPQVAVGTTEENNEVAEGDDKMRKIGSRAKMLTKKMGEKFEEKKRNLGEKGRHFVDKMRGPGGI